VTLRTPSLRRAGSVLIGTGVLLAVAGLLAIVAAGSWVLAGLGVVAAFVGGYVLLVGVGLLRAGTVLLRRRAERAVDEAAIALVAAAPPQALADCDRDGPCTACDGSCAFSAGFGAGASPTVHSRQNRS